MNRESLTRTPLLPARHLATVPAFTLWCALLLVALGSYSPPLAAQTPWITHDVVYGHKDGLALTYDVIVPEGRTNGAGVAFMVSGGWVSEWEDPADLGATPLLRTLTERGFVLYLVRHGSSPRYKVPDALDDARLAVLHIRERARDFGVDRDRIGLVGHSAGGHLALTVGLRAEGPTGLPDDPSNARATQVGAIVALAPPVDLRGWSGPNQRFPALDFDEEREIGSSPLLFATEDDPPTLLMHGDEDELVAVAHSQQMFDALERAGVVADLVVFSGAGHNFTGDDLARSASLTADWFERHLLTGR